MNFLDEAVYNVEKGATPPDPEDLKDDDIVNIGEDDIDEGVLSYFKQGAADLKAALKGGLTNDELMGSMKLTASNGKSLKKNIDTILKTTSSLNKQSGIYLNEKDILKDTSYFCSHGYCYRI